MEGLVLAWLAGAGIISWRSVHDDHLPPSPGRLMAASGFFALLALVARAGPGAARAATLLAVGIDVAAVLNAPLTSAGAKGKKAQFPKAGSAGNLQVIPDGGNGGAATGQAAATGAGASGGGGTSTGSAGPGGSVSANQAIAKQVIAANSSFANWGQSSQWDCLVKLWNQESSWNASAKNPSSGALGIAQSLTHPEFGFPEYGGYGLTQAQVAGANNGNAADQILWGLNYIAATYGSPCAAWNHEKNMGWY